MNDIESFPRLVVVSKRTLQNIFGDEASSQEVSESKTNRKLMNGKQNEGNKRIYLEKNSN